MITGLAFVLYPVTEMARSRAFYEQTLGLAPDESFGPHWIEYAVGSATFAITDGIPFTHPAASAAFEVDDLDSQLAGIQAAGIPVEGDVNDFPSCRMALIKDPDGSTICIHQRKR